MYHMNVAGAPERYERPPEERFQERLLLQPEAPPQAPVPSPPVTPQKRTPSQSPLMPRKVAEPPMAPAPSPPVTPQKRTPSQSPMMPRKVVQPPMEPTLVAQKRKPNFDKVCWEHFVGRDFFIIGTMCFYAWTTTVLLVICIKSSKM
jgi:hypothetical protein